MENNCILDLALKTRYDIDTLLVIIINMADIKPMVVSLSCIICKIE